MAASNMAQRNETLFNACYSVWPDEELVIEADGAGGATLMIVEGNYPVDFLIKHHRVFRSEDAACDAACEMLDATYY